MKRGAIVSLSLLVRSSAQGKIPHAGGIHKLFMHDRMVILSPSARKARLTTFFMSRVRKYSDPYILARFQMGVDCMECD